MKLVSRSAQASSRRASAWTRSSWPFRSQTVPRSRATTDSSGSPSSARALSRGQRPRTSSIRLVALARVCLRDSQMRRRSWLQPGGFSERKRADSASPMPDTFGVYRMLLVALTAASRSRFALSISEMLAPASTFTTAYPEGSLMMGVVCPGLKPFSASRSSGRRLEGSILPI